MKDKLYLPSNGTEGDSFIEMWCAKCIRDTTYRGGLTCCNILSNTMVIGKVKQWIYKDGVPTCTSFLDYRFKPKTHKKKYGVTLFDL